MTSIQDRDFSPVKNEKSVKDLSSVTRRFNGSFGVEEEAFYLDAQTLNQMEDARNKKLFKEVGFPMSVEPNAAQAEHVSAPEQLATLQRLLDQMQYKRERIYEVCEGMGVKRNPFSSMPHVDGASALKNMIKSSIEDPTRGVRQRLLMGAFGAANRGSPYYPVLNTALHYTTSVRDMDEDLEKGRRAQFLMPVLLTMLENRSPFNVGSNKGLLSSTFNQAMAARLDLKHRGGIDENYFIANSGEELAQLKFHEVMETEMFSYYRPKVNDKGEVESEFVPIDARKEKTPKFKELVDTPLGFRTQYYMARSQKWKWLKTKNLFDEKGASHTLLQERRDFDPGIHQLQTMTLILAAVDH
ncbi:MAG: hypothetical protein ACLFR0_05690, partial [Alphaproteobacteria bacterium]